jgi:hypothetical protein
MGMNFKCGRCADTGKIGFFRRQVCPQCNGDPDAYIRSRRPTLIPPAPPPRRYAGVVPHGQTVASRTKDGACAFCGYGHVGAFCGACGKPSTGLGDITGNDLATMIAVLPEANDDLPDTEISNAVWDVLNLPQLPAAGIEAPDSLPRPQVILKHQEASFVGQYKRMQRKYLVAGPAVRSLDPAEILKVDGIPQLGDPHPSMPMKVARIGVMQMHEDGADVVVDYVNAS